MTDAERLIWAAAFTQDTTRLGNSVMAAIHSASRAVHRLRALESIVTPRDNPDREAIAMAMEFKGKDVPRTPCAGWQYEDPPARCAAKDCDWPNECKQAQP